MQLKHPIIRVGFVMAVGSSTGFAQNTPAGADVVKVVNRCVNVVHNTRPAQPYLEMYYKNFDAFYNPASGLVQNNAQTVGDMQALFVFQKCMTEQGFPLK
jgi:hypothetical protein